MGAEKEGAKSDGEKKPADAGDGGKSSAAVSVFKMDMHCEGCAKKVKRVVKHMDGVEGVIVDTAGNKLTVTGKVDTAKIKARLEEKTKKKVDIVSQPKKDGGGGGGDKKPEEKSEKKSEEKKAEEKKPAKESTVVLKIRLHCDGCISKIKKIISKSKGVTNVAVDTAKEVVTVTGTMDVKELVPYLKDKLKRNVDVVPAKDEKKDGGGGGDKKADKKEGDGKTEKKEGGEGKAEKKEGDGGGAKVEVSKMEYRGYSEPGPSYWFDGGYGQSYSVQPYIDQGYGMNQYNHHPQGYPMNQGYVVNQYNHPPQGYAMNQGYVVDHHGYAMDYHNMQAPQMFSDENPNACSVM
ncbi:hypothetical protein K2173_002160 [Erythroxylum novogranatense]|uniref:HMA domain-containing protein n=1 Tax=Erythroxylum novogranatense TaxID=1862640 RepID=A0AAV8SQQ0_9ROSI|nr:hypothetical protein K2173_002160 [Erythroxylum novogranatense]